MPFKPRILVIETDPEVSRLITSTLQLMGTDPCLVTNRSEAGARIEGEKLDGAFIDWDNAQFDVLEIMQCIRNSRSNAKIPIALLGGGSELTQVSKGIASGATFFLAKPFGSKELARLLNATRGMMLEERRRYQRVPLSVPALCRWGLKRSAKSVTGRAMNISGSGMLLKLSPRPEAGTAVGTELTLPGARAPLSLQGVVVRSGPGEQVGVQFGRLGRAEHELIETFITAHPNSSLFPAR